MYFICHVSKKKTYKYYIYFEIIECSRENRNEMRKSDISL